MPTESSAEAQIDALVAAFFRVFNNVGGRRADLSVLHALFTGRALIVKASEPAPVIYDLDEFIAPRDLLLNDGSVVDFMEEEVSGRTAIFGRIAQRLTVYRKRGVAAGAPFETLGMKTFQFIETPDGWRMLSMAWDDERDGLRIDATVRATSR